MKVIENNILPFKPYAILNLFGILFVRKGIKITDKSLNHERIHTQQGRELLWIGFYIKYLAWWLWNLIFYRDQDIGYGKNLLEKEAYLFESKLDYIKVRDKYAYKYIGFLYITKVDLETGKMMFLTKDRNWSFLIKDARKYIEELEDPSYKPLMTTYSQIIDFRIKTISNEN